MTADLIDVSQFSNLDGVIGAVRRSAEYLVPPLAMLPSEFAEKNIEIPIGNAVPGPIRFDAAAYQRGMIDVIVEPGINRVSYMLGAQLGKTTLMQAISAYFTAHEPRSQIWLMPSEGDMQTFRATKLEPMFEANPKIAAKMAKPRDRNGKNNSRMISFIGGFMMFSWAGSAKTLRGRSAPVTIADEIDGMENAGTEEKDEGDPVQLLMQRAASFSSSGQNIHIESSTPTVKGFSRIESSHDQGDGRQFWVPCPHCGVPQVLVWEQVMWDGRQDTVDEDAANIHGHDVDSAFYVCIADGCGTVWTDGDRVAAVRAGEWIAQRPTKNHASFHLNELNSPFRKLRDIVQSYLDKLAVDSYNTFVNVSLAQTYEETAERVDATGLVARAEAYMAEAPMGVLYITCGVDMQGDRLELEFVGWGEGEESWSLGYLVLYGDPTAGDVWDDLDDALATEFTHESGMRMRVSATCVDTGGTSGCTQAAYEYLKGKTGRKMFGIKGVGGWGRPIVESPQRKQSGKKARKVDLFLVGVDEGKLLHMRRLAVEKAGPGYCHLPEGVFDLVEWAKQATAEKLRVKFNKGQPIRYWWKPDKARNEATDVRVYATAALKIMQPSFRRLRERLNAFIASRSAAVIPARAVPGDATPKIPEVADAPVRPQTPRIHKSAAARRAGGKNWVTGWKK